MYRAAPMQNFYRNSEISIDDGLCTISLPIHDGFFHAGQAVHGAVYFRMLDDAAYFAVSSRIPGIFIVTSSFNIELLRPVSEGLITATGRVRHMGKSQFIAEATLVNKQGKELAFGSGKFAKSKKSLDQELGYSI